MLHSASVLGMLLVFLAIFSSTDSYGKPAGIQRVPLAAYLSDLQMYLSTLCISLVGLCTSIMWGGIFNLAVEGLGKYRKRLPVFSWYLYAVAVFCRCSKCHC